MVSEKQVLDALRDCLDPEIGASIVDLGLVYGIKIDDGNNITVKMTLTTPHCPLSSMILGDVEQKVKEIEGVKSAKIELVFEPPWTPERMSPELKKKFGFEG